MDGINNNLIIIIHDTSLEHAARHGQTQSDACDRPLRTHGMCAANLPTTASNAPIGPSPSPPLAPWSRPGPVPHMPNPMPQPDGC